MVLQQHRGGGGLYGNPNYPDQGLPTIWTNQSDGGQSSLVDPEDEAKHLVMPGTSNPMEAYRGSSEGALHSFLEKVFSGSQDAQNRTMLVSFDDCRHRLESMFEEKYQPERDFLDYLLVKKERCYEDDQS